MLEVGDVDLGELADALDDHSALPFGHSWWFHPGTGEVRVHCAELDEASIGDLEDEGLVFIDPLPSSVGYADMEDFIERVADRRSRERLARAIHGRGAFRRFKNVLSSLPELRHDWVAFRDARVRHHAVEWLADNGLVSPSSVDEALARWADPPVPWAAGHPVPAADVPETGAGRRAPRLARAHDELAAARVLQAGGFSAAALSRAYVAAFHAAAAAVDASGRALGGRAVIDAFTEIVGGPGADVHPGRLLGELHERARRADTAPGPVPSTEGEQAIADAATIVATVEAWLAATV